MPPPAGPDAWGAALSVGAVLGRAPSRHSGRPESGLDLRTALGVTGRDVQCTRRDGRGWPAREQRLFVASESRMSLASVFLASIKHIPDSFPAAVNTELCNLTAHLCLLKLKQTRAKCLPRAAVKLFLLSRVLYCQAFFPVQNRNITQFINIVKHKQSFSCNARARWFLRRGWPRRRKAHLAARRAAGLKPTAPAACGCGCRHFLMAERARHCAVCRGSAEARAFPAQWVGAERTGRARCRSCLQRGSARTRLIAAQLLHKHSSGRATAPSYTAHNNKHNQTLSRCAANCTPRARRARCSGVRLRRLARAAAGAQRPLARAAAAAWPQATRPRAARSARLGSRRAR